MNIHKSARTTPYNRAGIVRRVIVLGETLRAGATALSASDRSVAKWLARSTEPNVKSALPIAAHALKQYLVPRLTMWPSRSSPGGVGASPTSMSLLDHLIVDGQHIYSICQGRML